MQKNPIVFKRLYMTRTDKTKKTYIFTDKDLSKSFLIEPYNQFNFPMKSIDKYKARCIQHLSKDGLKIIKDRIKVDKGI